MTPFALPRCGRRRGPPRLESVGARLVVGIARVDVPRKPLLGDLADYHLRDIEGAVYDSITIGADNGDGDTGKNLMGSGGERTQHRSGLVAICRFAEDPRRARRSYRQPTRHGWD